MNPQSPLPAPPPEGRTDLLTVEVSLPTTRLDVYLRQHYPCVSRNTLLRLIREGEVRVNDQPAKPTHHPRAGELISIRWPPPRPPTVEPRAIPIPVLYEDDSLLVLNKPAGMVVHPAAGTENNTLVNALLHHCQGRLSGVGGVARPGIVHRLDQFTSGLMVVAKDDPTHVSLSQQFAGRQVEKIYHAVLCGVITPPQGEIHAAIARHPNHRKVMTVLSGGRSAHTDYATLETWEVACLVEARLHTGRTHQVRVHFKYLGFPLLGDATYGKRPNASLAQLLGWSAPRQMLHAARLGFLHPTTRQRLTFTAPWPEDFGEIITRLRTPRQQTQRNGS